jgi:isoleucyl-tRNA synthetase
MAPFAPFLAEHVYRQLGALDGGEATPASVHLCDYPEAESQWVRPELEAAVERMQQVVLLGRQKREEVKIGLRMPLRSLTVVHRDPAVLAELERLEPYVLSELNVQRVRYDTDEAAHIEMVARPNFPVLGKRLGDRMKAFAQAIRSLDPEQVAVLADTGAVEIDGETFTDEEIEVRQQPRPGTNTVSNGRIAVDLDTGLDDELVRGGYAREIVNRLQRRRKELGLNVADRIAVCYRGDQALTVAAREHGDYIMRETLALIFEQDDNLQDGVAVTIDSLSLAFTLSVMTGEVET